LFFLLFYTLYIPMKKISLIIAFLFATTIVKADFVPSTECNTGEYNATLPAIQALYPTWTLENQESYAIDQCNTIATTGTVASCAAACDQKFVGTGLQACNTLCSYDVSFAERYVYVPTCSVDLATAYTTCMTRSLAPTYCLERVGTVCPAVLQTAYCTANELLMTIPAIQTLYPNFSISNAINYAVDQCYTVATSTNISACKAICATKLNGEKLSACGTICDYDADF
jgi:hypothetical protein